jgi:hypothetical protein
MLGNLDDINMPDAPSTARLLIVNDMSKLGSEEIIFAQPLA